MNQNQNSQDIKSLCLNERQSLLYLLLEAQKAGRNIEILEYRIKYWKMIYPHKTSFRMSEFDQNMQEYIKSLENELKEDKEFLSHVAREYCADQDECSEVERISKNTIKWN